ncbi:MAG: preprotein translocase subunit YajC [Candidatus Hydrogenedentota bacterium]|nr:MAG: preprotein translocase subunit YajC [Candidatus Hydrogenedentota bacterium]
MLVQMFPLILIFAVFWFLMIAPSRKKDRERRALLAALSKGDSVISSGGICGTIVGINDNTVVLKVSDDPPTKIEFLRSSISQVAPKETKDSKESKESKK